MTRPAELSSDLLLLVEGEPHPCPYLPDRLAREEYAFPLAAGPALAQMLLDNGYRRSSDVFYRPRCVTCARCVSMRVPVDGFAPTRSQRRVMRRNADVRVCCGSVALDDEHFDLYMRYQAAQHDGEMLRDRDDFERFFGRTIVETLEMSYRVDGRLVGVGIVDVAADGLSSVYFYFDPVEHRRSLGVFSGLCEIEECRRRGLRYWYLGYWIAGCRTMDYKRRFGPHELRIDGVWQPAAAESVLSALPASPGE